MTRLLAASVSDGISEVCLETETVITKFEDVGLGVSASAVQPLWGQPATLLACSRQDKPLLLYFRLKPLRDLVSKQNANEVNNFVKNQKTICPDTGRASACRSSEQSCYRQSLPELMTSIAFTADGLVLFAGGASGKLYVWHLTSGNLLKVLNAHYNRITCIRLGHDESALVTASHDGSICVFNTHSLFDIRDPNPSPYRSWSGHSMAVTDLFLWGPTKTLSDFVISGSADKTVKVWCTRSSSSSISTTLLPSRVSCVLLNVAYDELLVGCDEGRIYALGLSLALRPRRGGLNLATEDVRTAGRGRTTTQSLSKVCSESGNRTSTTLPCGVMGGTRHTTYTRTCTSGSTSNGEAPETNDAETNDTKIWLRLSGNQAGEKNTEELYKQRLSNSSKTKSLGNFEKTAESSLVVNVSNCVGRQTTGSEVQSEEWNAEITAVKELESNPNDIVGPGNDSTISLCSGETTPAGGRPRCDLSSRPRFARSGELCGSRKRKVSGTFANGKASLRQGIIKGVYNGHTGRVHCCVLTDDCSQLVSSAEDGVRIWDNLTRLTVKRLSVGCRTSVRGLWLSGFVEAEEPPSTQQADEETRYGREERGHEEASSRTEQNSLDHKKRSLVGARRQFRGIPPLPFQPLKRFVVENKEDVRRGVMANAQLGQALIDTFAKRNPRALCPVGISQGIMERAEARLPLLKASVQQRESAKAVSALKAEREQLAGLLRKMLLHCCSSPSPPAISAIAASSNVSRRENGYVKTLPAEQEEAAEGRSGSREETADEKQRSVASPHRRKTPQNSGKGALPEKDHCENQKAATLINQVSSPQSPIWSVPLINGGTCEVVSADFFDQQRTVPVRTASAAAGPRSGHSW